jgi:hypothetical protein
MLWLGDLLSRQKSRHRTRVQAYVASGSVSVTGYGDSALDRGMVSGASVDGRVSHTPPANYLQLGFRKYS